MPTRSMYRPSQGFWVHENGVRIRKSHVAKTSKLEARRNANLKVSIPGDSHLNSPATSPTGSPNGSPTASPDGSRTSSPAFGARSYATSPPPGVGGSRFGKSNYQRPKSPPRHATSLFTPSMEVQTKSAAGHRDGNIHFKSTFTPEKIKATPAMAAYGNPASNKSPDSIITSVMNRYFTDPSEKDTLTKTTKSPLTRVVYKPRKQNPESESRGRDFHNESRPYAMATGIKVAPVTPEGIIDPDVSRARRFGQKRTVKGPPRVANEEDDPLVRRITRRILEQRARRHHDDPWQHRTAKQRAASAAGYRNRRPEKVRPKNDPKNKDGPLGAPKDEPFNLHAAAIQKATWATRNDSSTIIRGKCSRSLYVDLPESKEGGMTADELREQRQRMKEAERYAKHKFRQNAGVHNRGNAFHRGRVNGQ